MKRRVYTLLQFFALNILFFAIYLNLIHKNSQTLTPVPASTNANVTRLAAIQEKKSIAAHNLKAKKEMAD